MQRTCGYSGSAITVCPCENGRAAAALGDITTATDRIADGRGVTAIERKIRVIGDGSSAEGAACAAATDLKRACGDRRCASVCIVSGENCRTGTCAC
ncbi:MAG: hypothetical protein NTV80_23680 [Verrucomicrobia bacterium]|nr:hypothetical protein [Verrucomicrobiota bacterium]